MSDPRHSRKSSVYLRLSVTDRCNLRCQYCRPVTGVPRRDRTAASDDELVELVALIDEELDVRKLRFTGGEPLTRLGLSDLVGAFHRRLPASRLALTTNGLFLGRQAAALREAGLTAVNVSLDCLEPDPFRAVTRGGRLAAALAGIRVARDAGFEPLKINTVLLRTYNGSSLPDFVRLAAQERAEIRFIELMPYGEGARLFRSEYLSAADALRRLADTFEYVGPAAPSATAERHRLEVDGRVVAVGFIPAVSKPFCEGCDRLRLDSRGQILGCLRSTERVDLLTPLREGKADVVRAAIRRCVLEKRPPGDRWPEQHMVSVGG